MDEFDDLDEYNGNAEHDMWADFTYQENTAELPYIFSAGNEPRDYMDDAADNF